MSKDVANLENGTVYMMNQSTADASLQIPPSLVSSLKNEDLFEDFDDDTFHALAQHMNIIRCNSGDTVINEGSYGQSLFYLVSGRLIVRSNSYETDLAELRPGAFFGEIGALFAIPRTATVIVASAVATIISLNREYLLNVLATKPHRIGSLVDIARTRYLRTRPAPLPLGPYWSHEDAIIRDLQKNFPFLGMCDGLFMINLLKRFPPQRDAPGTIISMAKDDAVLLLLEGEVEVRNLLTGMVCKKCAGEAVFIGGDEASSVEYVIVVNDSVVYLAVAKELFERFQDRDQGCVLEESLSLLNIAPETVAKAPFVFGLNMTKENAVHTIMFHEQVTQCPNSRKYDEAFKTEASQSQQISMYSSLVRLGTVLEHNEIHLAEISYIYPRVDELNFQSVATHTEDAFAIEVLQCVGSSVTMMNFSDSLITGKTLEFICKNFNQVAVLKLDDCSRIESNAFQQLLHDLPNLTRLSVANCPGFDEVCLDTLKKESSLLEIDFSYCRNVGTDPWPRMVPLSDTIERLSMRRIAGISEESIVSVPSSVIFGKLRILDLSDCAFLTTQALRHLLSSTHNLERLNLSFCVGLDETIAKAFIDVHYRDVTDVEAVPAKRDKLTHLNLSYCTRALTDRTIRALVKILPSLTVIGLRGARHLTAATLKSLLTLKKLEGVNLSNCIGLEEHMVEISAQAGNWTLFANEESVLNM